MLDSRSELSSVGLYDFARQFFTLFGLLSFPLCLFVGQSISPLIVPPPFASMLMGDRTTDAPFGRVVSKGWKMNGTVGWFLMEIMSPLSFLYALSVPPSHLPLPTPSFASLLSRVSQLPLARKVLATFFLIHYFNRAVISSFRNPSRARMNISVPLSALWFNFLNGFQMGTFVSLSPTSSPSELELGIKDSYIPLFLLGIALFLLGLAGNIKSDEILYALRRRSPSSTSSPPKERYLLPTGFLYSSPFGGVSFPNYTTEWLEWTGYLLASLALIPPCSALQGTGRPWGVAEGILGAPPMLFLINLVGVMLPRAMSGQRFYKDLFGERWPEDRKIVIPGLF